MNSTPHISVLIPVRNEAQCLEQLYHELTDVFETEHYNAEIIFSDDGSTDKTPVILQSLQSSDPRVRTVTFHENRGQNTALAAALREARGQMVISMDGDLQHDPADIPAIVKELMTGVDLVNGVRAGRAEGWKRALPSKLVNYLFQKILGCGGNDLPGGYNGYSRHLADAMISSGKLHHGFVEVAYLHAESVTEVIVKHHSRSGGKSQYRFRDLIYYVVKFLLVFWGPMIWIARIMIAGILFGIIAAYVLSAVLEPETRNERVFLYICPLIAGIIMSGYGLFLVRLHQSLTSANQK